MGCRLRCTHVVRSVACLPHCLSSSAAASVMHRGAKIATSLVALVAQKKTHRKQIFTLENYNKHVEYKLETTDLGYDTNVRKI